MKIINRVFAVLLVAAAISWIWLGVDVHRQVAADNEFYAKNVAPGIEASKREEAAFVGALRKRESGQVLPLPHVGTPDLAPMNLWVARIQSRNHLVFERDMVLIGLMGMVSVWSILVTILGLAARRRWEAPDRAAVPDAGKYIAELIRAGEVFLAKAEGGVDAPSVEVDGRRQVIVVRNLPFVAAFVGNPVRGQVELPFADLIATAIHFANGMPYLVLRTAKGKVTINGKVKPFDRLRLLLSDAAELNRSFPDRYRDALAREPRVRTPWYGWAFIGAALAAAGAAFWWFVVRR